MIFVDGARFRCSTQSSSPQASDILIALMENPFLTSAATLFKAIPEKIISFSEESGSQISTHHKYVYLFQREYVTVDPMLVELVGMDEATTCVGFVIRNRKNGMTSVAHMDSPNVVDVGLAQMLSLVVDHDSDAELDVHLIGGFEDVSHKKEDHGFRTGSAALGYSLPLCTKVIEVLERSRERMHIQTLFILRHNTRRDPGGIAFPIFNGFLVESSTGTAIPASFDKTSRSPDEIVRRIRLSMSFADPIWKRKLLETYDTRTDQFIIAPCSWSPHQMEFSLMVQELSDSEILLRCSTSPFAEGPDFVDNARRISDYLIEHPNWWEIFPMKQPRVFKRSHGGGWIRC